jgi:hypothetical protein
LKLDESGKWEEYLTERERTGEMGKWTERTCVTEDNNSREPVKKVDGFNSEESIKGGERGKWTEYLTEREGRNVTHDKNARESGKKLDGFNSIGGAK